MLSAFTWANAQVADALVQGRCDVQLTVLECLLLPQREPEVASHLNLAQTEPLAVGGQVADQQGNSSDRTPQRRRRWP